MAAVPTGTLALTAADHSKTLTPGFPHSRGTLPHCCRNWATWNCTNKKGTFDGQGRSGRRALKSAVQHAPQLCNKVALAVWVGTGNSCSFSRLLQRENAPGGGGELLVDFSAPPSKGKLLCLRWVRLPPYAGIYCLSFLAMLSLLSIRGKTFNRQRKKQC